jgi:peroxiredoxin
MRRAIGLTTLLALVFTTAVMVRAGDQKDQKGQAQLGQAAPAFALEDQNGKQVSLSDYKGKIVVLEWFNNECPYVIRHYENKTMSTLAAKYGSKDVVWLAVNTTNGKTNADNKAIAEKWTIGYPILNDSSGAVGQAYGAKTTPHMFIINTDGVLVYNGGIDDDQGGNKPNKTNYVDKALTELTSGESISTPQSKPYGCSVKYGS